MKNNVTKEYTSSCVVYIQDKMANKWRKVLEKHLTFHKMDKIRVIFKDGTVTVTLYIKPKKDPRSKIHVQSGSQERNLAFIMDKLSSFYHEVVASHNDVMTVKEVRNMEKALCGQCGKHFSNKKGVKQHIMRMHFKKRPPKVLKCLVTWI